MRHLTSDGRPPACPICGAPIEAHWEVFQHHRCWRDFVGILRAARYGMGQLGARLSAQDRRRLAAILDELHGRI
ncbi:MAG TPA: hypothetical protein VNP04_07230 [Alphaproteobacteria bacterium]|nr:hypothetical protein [Alphaproteobacteria bacterium]